MAPDEIMKEILEHKLEIEKLSRKLDLYSRIVRLLAARKLEGLQL